MRKFFYSISLAMIAIQLFFVLFYDHTFSALESNLFICFSILFLILAKLIIVLKKRKENKNYAWDIGIIISSSFILVERLM